MKRSIDFIENKMDSLAISNKRIKRVESPKKIIQNKKLEIEFDPFKEIENPSMELYKKNEVELLLKIKEEIIWNKCEEFVNEFLEKKMDRECSYIL